MAERKPSRRIAKSVPEKNEIVLKDRVVSGTRNTYKRATAFIKRRPLTSFLIVLGLLLLFLILGRLFQQQPEDAGEKQIVKTVKIYSIGEGPQAEFQAKIEKTGVVQIVAQAGGIVQSIPVKEGQAVNKGQLIVSLSNNYQGGNAASVQRQIAQTQYQNAVDTYGMQIDLINKQKDVATASASQAQRTRDITQQSIGETNDLINANQTQLDQMRQQLTTLQAATPTGTTNPQVAELQGAINQLQGGINQLRSAQRTAEFQASNEQPPAQLANLQKDVTLKQLEIQEKTVAMNKEVAKLQVNLAYVNEAIMYPSSPFAGTVERINVRVGQSVSPGAVLATITATTVESSAVLFVPQDVATVISQGEPSYLQINGKSVAVTPYYVSTQATEGQLYTVYYDIPTEEQKNSTDGEYIIVKVPLGKADTTAASPLIPIDAVYQTKDKTYVLVKTNDKAESRTVTSGEVFGGYVQVTSGLKSGDQIILNRNVIAGDTVKLN